MAQHSWIFDAPTGTYKDHALSAKIFEAAVENAKFAEHAQPVSGYGKGKGESVTLTRLSSMDEATSVTLAESQRIPEDSFAQTTKQVTVAEIGRAVPYTSLAVDLAHFDLENTVQRRLRNQMERSLDTLAATAYKSTQIKYQITGTAAGTFTTNGTFGGASTANMNVYHCEEIRDYMFDTLYAPPAAGDDYIGIFRTLGIRGLKRDPDWDEWHKYTDPQSKFNSEVGRMEAIRFVETNHNNALGKVGTGSVLGEGVVFGEDSVALAEAMTPELRAAMPTDFGRSRAVAWYGILKFDLIWDTGNAGQAKVVHVGST